MWKTLRLELNEFDPVPHSLCDATDPSKWVPHVSVDLAKLYHHYYVDTWGTAPPDPDPARFEHIQYLLPTPEFRFIRNGLGSNKTSRGNTSNELGQAFCRWFLEEHVDISYFAHFDDVCGHGALSKHGNVYVTRKPTGLAPDYFCSSSPRDIYLAEAKGTTVGVGFTSAKFDSWRKQFDCVEIHGPSGVLLAVKGFIVSTRWAFEHQPRAHATLSAEDPVTRGEVQADEFAGALAQATMAVHYGRVANKLNLHPLSSVLRRGVRLPDELSFRLVVWEFLLPPLAGRRFVGGYFPADDGRLPIELNAEGLVVRAGDPLRLDQGTGTFFGVDEKIFGDVMKAARSMEFGGVRKLEERPFIDSSMSLLSDGTVLGPVQMFRPVDVRQF